MSQLFHGAGLALHGGVGLLLDLVGVGEEAQQALDGHRVDTVRRAHAPHPLDILFVSHEQAQSQAGQSPGFGKGAADDQVGSTPVNGRLAVIFKVGFVEYEHGVGELPQPVFEGGQGKSAAGGVIR